MPWTKVREDKEQYKFRNIADGTDTGDTAVAAVVTGPDGNEARVNDDGQLHIVGEAHLCPCNSTEINLGIDGVFTGDSKDISAYNGIAVFVTSDVASAIAGLKIQYSKDGSTKWRTAEEYDILAGAEKYFTPPAFGKFFRVMYINGPDAQADFELTTVFRKFPFKWSSHNIDKPIADQDDAVLVKAVITGKKANGDFDNASLTNGGNVKVSLEELEAGISSNSKTQLNTTSFDSSGNEGQTIIGTNYIVGNSGIDPLTEALHVISDEHQEIHEGNHFNYCDYALSQASGVIIEFILTTPNTTKWAHLTFKVAASTGATIEVFAGTSGVTGGTTITPRNNNGNSANVSGVTLIKDPTAITTDGLRAAGYLAGGGRVAGFASRDNENLLAQNLTYMLRVTTLAAQNDVSWCAEWYEHTNNN